MNATLKALIVWLLLLALPVQGFASAKLSICAPVQAVVLQAQYSECPDDMQSEGADTEHKALSTGMASMADTGDHCAAQHHADGKSGSCSACTIGAAMAPSFAITLPLHRPPSEHIPFGPAYLPAVDLAHPERPPRA